MSDLTPKYDLFLSYNSLDREEVQAIRRQLGKLPKALTAFLDRESLTLGKRWFEEIESALLNSRAIAVFYGPNGLGRWQNLEMILALDLQANPNAELIVIPVLLPGADLNKAPRFLLLNSYLDLRSGHDSTSLGRLAQHVLGQPTTLNALSANDELRNPYRGLNYFREQDAPLFFGRQYESQKLLEKVKSSSLIALVGNSGTGKSSVVRAGLIPLLRKQHMPDPTWEVLLCIPALDNANPFHNLAAAFLESWGNSTDQIVEKRPGIEATLRTTLSLVDCIRQTLRKCHNPDKLLLIIDQFEELLNFDTLGPEIDDLKLKTDFELFVELLLNAVNTEHCSVLLTIRGDYYGAVTERHAKLAEKIEKGTITLSRLQDIQLQDIIVKPAQLAGGRFEDGLPERIIDDVGKKPGNLALLEFALTSLWNYQSQGWLNLRAYQTDVGKLEGAISAEADRILQSDKVTDRVLALTALTRLVWVSSTEADGGDTRQRVPLTNFSKVEYACLKPFIKSHLLLASGSWKDKGEADQQPITQAPTLEVSHEALIRHWPTLQDALKDKREVLIWRQTIRRQYEGWKPLHDAGFSLEAMDKWLLKGIHLEQGTIWEKERNSDLIGDETAFIADSKKFEAMAELRTWRKNIRLPFEQWQNLVSGNSKKNIKACLLSADLLQQGLIWLSNNPSDLLDVEKTFIRDSKTNQDGGKMKQLLINTLFIGCALIILSFFLWSINNGLKTDLALNILRAKYLPLARVSEPDMVAIIPNQDCNSLAKPCHFMMGNQASDSPQNEQPAHKVYFAKSYKIGRHEVTFDEYELFAYLINQEGGCSNDDGESKRFAVTISDDGKGKGQRPVIYVTWHEAKCYVNWLNRMLESDNLYRLPSEAEWEYAARAGKATTFFWGEEDTQAERHVWFSKNSGGRMQFVGALGHDNAFGIYDMIGNVFEWTEDCWHDNYQDTAPDDGSAWVTGGDCSRRVRRGGSWHGPIDEMHSAYRDPGNPLSGEDNVGFRLAQD